MDTKNMTDAQIRNEAERLDAEGQETGNAATLEEAARLFGQIGMMFRATRCLIAADILRGEK